MGYSIFLDYYSFQIKYLLRVFTFPMYSTNLTQHMLGGTNIGRSEGVEDLLE